MVEIIAKGIFWDRDIHFDELKYLLFILCICYLFLGNKLHQSLVVWNNTRLSYSFCAPGIQMQFSWVPLIQGLSQRSSEDIGWGCSHLKAQTGKDPFPSSFLWLLTALRPIPKLSHMAVSRPQVLAGCSVGISLLCYAGFSVGLYITWELAFKSWKRERETRKMEGTVFLLPNLRSNTPSPLLHSVL